MQVREPVGSLGVGVNNRPTVGNTISLTDGRGVRQVWIVAAVHEVTGIEAYALVQDGSREVMIVTLGSDGSVGVLGHDVLPDRMPTPRFTERCSVTGEVLEKAEA